MTDQEIIDVLTAHRDGREIECRYSDRGVHTDDWARAVPSWDFAHYDYRVKPEPPKPREWWINGIYAYTYNPATIVPPAVHVREVLE